MGRAGILYSHVAAAAARLAADGKNPTVDTVREALGATGSKSTIAPLLKRWKEEQQAAFPVSGPAIPAVLLQAVRGVYDGLRAEAAQQLEDARITFQANLDSARDEARQLRVQVARQAADHAAIAGELERANAALGQVRVDNQELSVTVAGVQSDNVGLLQRLADRAAEVTTLSGQLTHARTQFEHYQEATAMQRSEERQSFEHRIAQQDHELGRMHQHVSSMQTAAAQHQGRVARIIEENERLQGELRSGQQQLMQLQTERNLLAAAHPALQEKHDHVVREFADARTLLAVQCKELTLAGDRLTSMERRSEAQTAENVALLQQVSALQAELRLAKPA